MLKRSKHATFHLVSFDHLDLFFNEFAGRHNQQIMDTDDQLRVRVVATSLSGKRLTYNDLSDNGYGKEAQRQEARPTSTAHGQTVPGHA